MASAFFEPDGDGFVATPLTRGPWDPTAQHAGPPAALLGRAVQQADGGGDKRVGRITLDIIRPVPVARLTVSCQVVRPGRNVDLVEARLADPDGPVVLARAWRIRDRPVDVPRDDERAPAGPEAGETRPFFDVPHLEGAPGYHRAVETSFLAGGFREPGPATVWMRMRVPLVDGEEPSPLVRVLVVADSGNGVSARLDPRRHLFINTDLTVNLLRPPVGEWVCLDARTVLVGSTVGLAETRLFDRGGRIGGCTQTLYVSEQQRGPDPGSDG